MFASEPFFYATLYKNKRKGNAMEEKELYIAIAELTEQMKVANHRISDLEETTKRIESLTLSVEKLAMSVESMAKEQMDYRAKQNELASRLLDIEQKPYKDKALLVSKIVEHIAIMICGGFCAWLIFKATGIQI